MARGVDRRLARLEARAEMRRCAPGWTREAMTEKVLDELDFAHATSSPVFLCREELALVGAESVEDLPEWLRPHVELRPPSCGQILKRYEYPPEAPFVGWRDRVCEHEERVRAFEEESRQRDRELLERNRAECGLPPLTPEQITRWNLGNTRWEGEA